MRTNRSQATIILAKCHMQGVLWRINGWLRARRHCAEQETPGGQTRNLNKSKGGFAMVKSVFFRMSRIHPVALAICGWVAFVLGQLVQPISLKLVLLSAAKVLP